MERGRETEGEKERERERERAKWRRSGGNERTREAGRNW